MNRRELWSALREFAAQCEGEPWLVGGDFNEIRKANECEGRRTFDHLGAAEFKWDIEGLIELDTLDGKFTWMNGTGVEHTKTRLYRMLAILEWVGDYLGSS